MASYTASDLTAIEAAIKSGALSVKHGDKMVTYRSLAEMERVRDMIARSLASPTRKRITFASHSRGS